MAGIYIHIPFCRKACTYCNFHFSTGRKGLSPLVDALCQEIELRKDTLSSEVETIYFGGGTPSLLSPQMLEKILSTIHRCFKLSLQEMTIEANPEDINEENLKAWRSLGINRLSIGIQSFFNEDLIPMNRAHTAEQAERAVLLSQEHGWKNISIDLIYGIPWSNEDSFAQNLDRVVQFSIPHLSAYALTVEPKTALDHHIRTGKVAAVSQERSLDEFRILQDWASSNAFDHYEISNLCIEGFQSKHNCSYWEGKHYLGIGPSAHSFNSKKRTWNISNNAMYIKALEEERLPVEEEILSEFDRFNEFILTRTRLSEGFSFEELRSYGQTFFDHTIEALNKGLMEHFEENDHRYSLRPESRFLADGIAAQLFYLDPASE